jgi:hypothetical protein
MSQKSGETTYFQVEENKISNHMCASCFHAFPGSLTKNGQYITLMIKSTRKQENIKLNACKAI